MHRKAETLAAALKQESAGPEVRWAVAPPHRHFCQEAKPGEISAERRALGCDAIIRVSGSSWNLIQLNPWLLLLGKPVIPFCLSGHFGLDFCLLQPKRFD